MASSTSAPWWLPLRHALGRVRRRFALDTFDIFVRRVGPSDRDFDPHFEATTKDGKSAGSYRFAWGTPADILGCDAHHTELDERERILGARRLEFGHQVVVVFHAQTVVFSMWVNPRNLNVPGALKRALDPHQAFIYKAFTSPEHRGRKLYEAGMRFVLADLARQGKTELVGYAHVKKDVSRKGLAALQFETMGRFRVLRLPGFQTTLTSAELRRNFPKKVQRSRTAERLASPSPPERIPA
ncbi:MAG: hypothetical protein JNJ88_14565 [Planctomycetes bacterium]|nr:hypothetical protein [Planctomycetota bacterium]